MWLTTVAGYDEMMWRGKTGENNTSSGVHDSFLEAHSKCRHILFKHEMALSTVPVKRTRDRSPWEKNCWLLHATREKHFQEHRHTCGNNLRCLHVQSLETNIISNIHTCSWAVRIFVSTFCKSTECSFRSIFTVARSCSKRSFKAKLLRLDSSSSAHRLCALSWTVCEPRWEIAAVRQITTLENVYNCIKIRKE